MSAFAAFAGGVADYAGKRIADSNSADAAKVVADATEIRQSNQANQASNLRMSEAEANQQLLEDAAERKRDRMADLGTPVDTPDGLSRPPSYREVATRGMLSGEFSNADIMKGAEGEDTRDTRKDVKQMEMDARKEMKQMDFDSKQAIRIDKDGNMSGPGARQFAVLDHQQKTLSSMMEPYQKEERELRANIAISDPKKQTRLAELAKILAPYEAKRLKLFEQSDALNGSGMLSPSATSTLGASNNNPTATPNIRQAINNFNALTPKQNLALPEQNPPT